MSIYDVLEFDTIIGSLLQGWQDSVTMLMDLRCIAARTVNMNILWWIGWVDDHGILRLVIGDEVGVIVASTLPL